MKLRFRVRKRYLFIAAAVAVGGPALHGYIDRRRADAGDGEPTSPPAPGPSGTGDGLQASAIPPHQRIRYDTPGLYGR